MAPSQLQAAPTPRRRDGSKDKKDQTNERSGLLPLGTIWQSFFCTKLPEGRRKKIAKLKKVIACPMVAQDSGL